MDELIKRLTEASGPDGILDIYLDQVRKGRPFREVETWWFNTGHVAYKDGGKTTMERPPAYTASIDAALTLVPEGRSLMMLQSGDGHTWNVVISKAFSDEENRRFYVDGDAALLEEDRRCYIEGPHACSLPIALCIAVLRARAQAQKGDAE